MKITPIHAGLFKLDGGAMFGVVPKQLWSRKTQPDDNNMCTWAMRCLLIQTEGRNILVDTGMGNKQDEKFRKHFEPHGEQTLLGSLADHGLAPDDISDVFLTHLHFDHVGGAVRYDEDGQLVPTFPRATYWSNERHYDWAYRPNAREAASFLHENFVPLRERGVLRFLPTDRDRFEWLPGLEVQLCYGHTDAMMALHLDLSDRQLCYAADLLPSSFHVSLPWVMSYDVRPLQTLAEKQPFLEEMSRENAYVFFEHDPATAAGKIYQDERGRYRVRAASEYLG